VSRPGNQLLLFPAGGDPEALEVFVEPDVGVEPGRVGVEVQKGAGAAVEIPALVLLQTRQLPELDEQRLELIEVVLPRVTHTVSLPRALEAASK
jgi:hypothetical protein